MDRMKRVKQHNSFDCRFGNFVVTVVRDMIIPNCVWKAGRVASAIRTTAISCLWALLEGSALSREKVWFIFVSVNSVCNK